MNIDIKSTIKIALIKERDRVMAEPNSLNKSYRLGRIKDALEYIGVRNEELC